ncbi:MAG TPA: ATP-binding protein [Polyangia bacterium]|nr:ATP-binding protein [Polyangia bacterium]
MRLKLKLTLLALGVSAVPLAIAGYWWLSIGQGALRAAIEDNELTVAKQVAEHAGSEMGNLLSILRTDARIFDLTRGGPGDAPSAQGLLKFLQLVYHQSDDFCAIAMFDEHGAPVGQPAYLETPSAYETFRNHEPMRPTDVEGVGLMAPLGQALSRGDGVGPVFLGGPARVPHVVLAVAFDPKLGGGKRVLTAEVSLRRLGDYVKALSDLETDVRLLDARARLVAAGAVGGVAHLEAQHPPGGHEGELATAATVAAYASAGRAVIGAYAPTGPWGFGVVVEKAADAALLPVNRIRWATLFWLGVSIVVGSIAARIFARRLASRVETLSAGSRQIAAGHLETRIAKGADDELGDLAIAFNRMAEGLDGARAKITQQTSEIMSWNQTLERRVEEKTRELREAQDLLLRSRSLAAIGQLGAGVAHEINNPLAGVLGIAQLLIVDLPPHHPARPLVQDVETQALRIRKIVQNLLRFAQRQGGEDYGSLDLGRVLDDALELCGPTDLQTAGIQVVRRYAQSLPTIRGSATQLQEAFIQLMQNARVAMSSGDAAAGAGSRGTLTLETSVTAERLARVTVTDTGRGINAEHLPRIFDPFFTTKVGDWSGVGMGLSVVHKTIEDHGGTIQVQSALGKGSSFQMTFPIVVEKAVLA